MKSEFALAFNQICAEYDLPRDVVLDAVRAAMLSAYRRDWDVGPNQNMTAEINLETGLARIYLEKEVVSSEEDVGDEKTQVALEAIQKRKPHAEVGDEVMVDVTPDNFGRIAAQTAKQVITQRLREAERESQFHRFSRQENEIIIGTVQSIKPHGVTLHLERTEEALMPRREQIPSERYRLHQKIRVYVLQVKRSPRGPEIIVSRSHPLMLRRLLELEVPEIRNGQVEVKAIAREAGGRSKVAVTTDQSGLDPVGACIGMRGIRVQTISRELSDERIDVVEWNEDTATFIGNALSMDVLDVTLDELNPNGRTASVMVRDDQLSLAIGRAGQNARLAAKLTGWRVDIRGITEATMWALEKINATPDMVENIDREAASLIPQLAGIMREHQEHNYSYTDEEQRMVRTVVRAIHRAFLRRRDKERPEVKQLRKRRSAQRRAEEERIAAAKEALERVPREAYDLTIMELDLPEKVKQHLTNSGLKNAGEVMERLAIGDEELLMLTGIGVRALSEIKQAIETSDLSFLEREPEAVVLEEAEEAEEAAEVEIEEAADVEAVEEVEEEVAAEVEEIEEEIEIEEAGEEVVSEAVEEAEPEPESDSLLVEEAEEIAERIAEEVEEEEAKAEVEEEEAAEPELEKIFGGEKPSLADKFKDYEYDYEEEELFEEKDKKKEKKRTKPGPTLIYDEETGEMIPIRRRHRKFDEVWDEYLDEL
jgi:N utilization substance protein A